MKLRITLGAAALIAAVLPATGNATANASDYRAGDCGNFTVAMIPDTQNYTDYRHQTWSEGRGQTAKDAGREDDVGDGWLRLLNFRIDGAKSAVEVRTYSTHYRKYAADIPEYGTWYKAHDGQAALSDKEYLEREEFTIDLKGFDARFPAAGRAQR